MIAGYPADKPDGECDIGTCQVNYECASDSTQHYCDTYPGMSGSPVWDASFNIRGE